MRTLPFLLACVLLSACATRPLGLTPSSAEIAPTSPPVLCPAAVKSPSRAAPLPPPGLTRDGFYGPLQDFIVDALGEEAGKAWWEWFTTSVPKWGAEGWQRLDKARSLPPCS